MAKLNHYILITIVITLCLHLSCARRVDTERASPGSDPAAVAAAVSEAEGLFRQREDISKLRDAVATLARFRSPDRRTFEVEWRFAKYNYFLGIESKDEKEAEKAFEQGRDAGKLAADMKPDMPDGYFWYGSNLGELSRLDPVTVG